MLGANPLVRDDVRVLLRSMGYHCVVAATLEHALELPEREQPDAAILDPHFPDSPPARVVAMFHKRVPDLRNRFIVLVRRSEERRVGKECRYRVEWEPYKKKMRQH